MTDEIPEPEWAEKRRWWYSQTYIGLELAKLLQHREMVILEKKNPAQEQAGRRLKTIRCCAGFTYDLLKSNFEAFSILQHPYTNLYYSLMHFEKTPLFSFAPAPRAESYKIWTNGGYKDQYTGYDFGCDFDGEDGIKQAQKDCLHIHRMFDIFKIPHSIRFSGNRGFHLSVDYRWLPQLQEEQIVEFCGKLGTMMRAIDGLETLDDSIFDSRRVFKLPYSFCQGNIVLPLDDDQIENFDISIVKPEYVLKAITLKNRGILERHTNQSEEQARKSFLKMASQFIEVSNYVGSWIHSKTKE